MVGFLPIAGCQMTAFFQLPLQTLGRVPWVWFCVAALISIALTSALVRVAPATGWVVFPRQNRWNRRVVAQFGGIPILLVFWFAALLLSPSRQYPILLFCTAALGLMGLVDDRRGLGPGFKLAVELLLACSMVHAGVVYPLTPSLIANQFLTLLWIAGITNAFNLIDNMDGLAAGVAVIALGTITVVAGVNSSLGILAMLLLASMGGFLLFNLYPAKVFMGDVGSLPTGFFLACASVMAAATIQRRGTVILFPGLLLAVPLFDVILVSVTRPLNGRSISDGARDHTSHRLVFLGMSEAGAVRLLHGIAFIAGVLAVCQAKSPSRWLIGFVAMFGVALARMWSGLAGIRLPEAWLSLHPGRILRLPPALGRLASVVLPLVRDAALPALAIYFSWLIVSSTIAGRLSGGASGGFSIVAMLPAILLTAILLLLFRSSADFLDRLFSGRPILAFVRRPPFGHAPGEIQDEAGTAARFATFVPEADEAELEAGRGRG